MPLKNRFSQVIGLSSLDVFIETPPNDDTYFEIEGLSPVLGYGKHGFRLTFKDPVNKPLLKNNSPIETPSLIKASAGEIDNIQILEIGNLVQEIK